MGGYSQITINRDDMPSSGDTIRVSTGLNVDFTDPEDTGEDYYWDYEELVPIVQRVDTFVRVNQTPIFYWPFFLLDANLATPLVQDSPFPELPLTDVFGFFNSSNTRYEDVGFAATLFGLPLPFKYDDPDILYRFPLNYGDVDSSASGFQFGIPDVAFVMVERKRKNTVDGWGTLTTPYGTFEVLRVKSEVTEYDSIYLDTLGVGIPVNREFIEYKWLGKGHGLPLLEITDNLLGFVVDYVDSARNETVGGVEDISQQLFDLLVYPNPAKKNIHIKIPGLRTTAMKVSLFNLNGKMVFTTSVKGAAEMTVDLERLNLKPGQYLIKAHADKKVLTAKFVYTH
jgi:hypothetical protein